MTASAVLDVWNETELREELLRIADSYPTRRARDLLCFRVVVDFPIESRGVVRVLPGESDHLLLPPEERAAWMRPASRSSTEAPR
jgi:hypothetical protein